MSIFTEWEKQMFSNGSLNICNEIIFEYYKFGHFKWVNMISPRMVRGYLNINSNDPYVSEDLTQFVEHVLLNVTIWQI